MGLFLKVIAALLSSPSHPTTRETKLEREMDAYGLEEHEKELVRKGEYDPWDFEEEEMDEDSYYRDDT